LNFVLSTSNQILIIEIREVVDSKKPENEVLALPLKRLIEALPFVDSAEKFAAVIEGIPLAAVDEAIFVSSAPHRREQLKAWLKILNQPFQIKVGDRLRLARDLFTTTKGKVVEILEWFGDSGRTNGGLVALSEINSGTWELVTG
jgi:hypothetical protein